MTTDRTYCDSCDHELHAAEATPLSASRPTCAGRGTATPSETRETP